MERFVTSSFIPTVKWTFGFAASMLQNTAWMDAGDTSFEERPYRQAKISGDKFVWRIAAHTSSYKGSPKAPGSFVRSNTVMRLTVFGKACVKCGKEKGRYK